jgi:hypothetical protein
MPSTALERKPDVRLAMSAFRTGNDSYQEKQTFPVTVGDDRVLTRSCRSASAKLTLSNETIVRLRGIRTGVATSCTEQCEPSS